MLKAVTTFFRGRWRKAEFWLIVMIGLFVLNMGLNAYFRQRNFITSEFDLGNMIQVLWQSLHGHWFRMADTTNGMLVSRTATHADFLLLAYLPFYAIFTNPLTLMFGQVLAVASGALPLFWLARQKVSAKFGLLAVGLFFLNPSLLWATSFDVHAVILVTPLILWLWWLVEKKKWWWAATIVCLALLGKEEVGLVIALNGIFWLFSKATRKFGIFAFVIGLSWSILMIGWAIPRARYIPQHFAMQYYQAYGKTNGEILKTIITKPQLIVHDLFRPEVLHYYINILLPLGGASLIGLPVLLISAPELALNILSRNGNMQTIFFQYTAVITPYIFLSFVFGWSYWQNKLQNKYSPQQFHHRQYYLIGILLFSALFSIWRWSPLPGMRYNSDVMKIFSPSPYRLDVNMIQKLVPPNESLAVSNNIAPQFSQRDKIWAFPSRLDLAEGIIVLEGGDYDPLPPEQINQKVAELVKDPEWTLVYHRQDLYYFRRVVK